MSGRRIEARTYAPSADLSDVVEVLWTGRWDLRGQAPHVTELLGDPCAHVVLERGSSRLVGVWTRRWTRVLEGEGLVRAAKLRSGALRALTDEPARRWTDRIVPLGEVLAIDVAATERSILEPDEDRVAFARLEELLRAVRRPCDAAIDLACVLVRTITEDVSITTVDALAARAGTTPRALQRLFREHVGASPKWAIRRARLQELARRLEKGEVSSLARVAAELGYTDQAHLARDFKGAVGKTPREFASSVHR